MRGRLAAQVDHGGQVAANALLRGECLESSGDTVGRDKATAGAVVKHLQERWEGRVQYSGTHEAASALVRRSGASLSARSWPCSRKSRSRSLTAADGYGFFRDRNMLTGLVSILPVRRIRMNANEEAVIRAVSSPPHRTRWLESLALAKRRVPMLDRLNHCRDIDERYATPLPSNTNVVALLRSRGASGDVLCPVKYCWHRRPRVAPRRSCFRNGIGRMGNDFILQSGTVGVLL